MDESLALKNHSFWCINVTATFSKMLVVFFIFVIFINLGVCCVALIGWDSIREMIPSIVEKENDEIFDLGEAVRDWAAKELNVSSLFIMTHRHSIVH